MQHHVGTVGLGGVDLQGRGDLRHQDRGLRAALTGGVGHALGMVAGGGGDDAAGQLLFAQGGDLVVGAADLERSGDLQVLGLEQYRVAGHLRQDRRRDDLRVLGCAAQALGGELQFGGVVALQCFEDVFLFHTRHCRRVRRITSTDVHFRRRTHPLFSHGTCAPRIRQAAHTPRVGGVCRDRRFSAESKPTGAEPVRYGRRCPPTGPTCPP